MNLFSLIQQSSLPKRFLCGLTAFFFLGTSVFPNVSMAQAVMNLPVPGSVVAPTAGFAPVMIKGVNLYPDNPLKFDFIIDKGDSAFTNEEFKKESTRLIKYFLSSLTVPEDEMWVNLSPYEKNRIVPADFGKTEMGRDLLAQDYMLKQLTASLMNPDDKLGGEFWQRVYAKAQEKYGTTDIPMNTFNKIWIVPEKAVVYEHEKGAYVVKSHLKIMLEEDYLALEVNKNSTKHGLGDVKTENLKVVSGVQSAIIKDLLIPEIEKEVNEGKTFANLRQIYNAVILASWYKQALKESLLGQVYVDQKKTKGVETDDKTVNEKIYNQYVESFKKGVYNYIKEDYNPETQEVVNRKYFSGGEDLTQTSERTEIVNGVGINDVELAKNMVKFSKIEVDLASLSTTTIQAKGSFSIRNKTQKQQAGKDIDSAMTIEKISSTLKEIRNLSTKDFNERNYVDNKIKELFLMQHTQESFSSTLKALRGLWRDKQLKQSRGKYVGLDFEDAVAYYLADIINPLILQSHIKFLIHTPNSKEIIARFGTELKAHLTLQVFHKANEVASFIDQQLIPLVIEGFVNQMKTTDFQLNDTKKNSRKVFLNLYLLLSLIDPNIYPDTTLESKKEYVIPEKATWKYAMNVFERAFTDKFGKEEYLKILMVLNNEGDWMLGAYRPWSFTQPSGLFVRKMGEIGALNFYGYKHTQIKTKEKLEKVGAKILASDSYRVRNNLFRRLLGERIKAVQKRTKSSDAAMPGEVNVSKKRINIDLAATLANGQREENNKAMTATKGGIDLNPTILSTEIKRNGRGVIIPTFKGSTPNLNAVEGFVPNIINVTPITNLRLLLGLDARSDENLQQQKLTEVSYNLSALSIERREEFAVSISYPAGLLI